MDEAPTDQHLTAKNMAVITRAVADDPPEFALLLDVQHDEAGLDWRQEVTFSRSKAVELTQLMDYSLTQVGVQWRPGDAADHTPPQ